MVVGVEEGRWHVCLKMIALLRLVPDPPPNNLFIATVFIAFLHLTYCCSLNDV